METLISWDDFEKIALYVGTILRVKPFPKAKKAAYQLEIDFGHLGIRQSSAQITELYAAESLVGRQIVAVLNFPPKQIANFISECLVLGAYDAKGIVLLQPEQATTNGTRIG
jgi:tRNA-binding protein